MCSAAQAARIERLSRSLLGSALNTCTCTWTSLRYSSGNSERIVRSMSRLDQHFVVADAAFAAAEAAGDAAGRGELLAVLDGQREEVLAGFGGLPPR
jgi:hypothetical protein